MRVPTPSIAVAFALLCGCAHNEMHFTKGKGDMGQFVMQQALKRGARPQSTNSLPTLGGQWRCSEDEYGVVLQLPRARFSEVQAFLRQAFGPPAQEPMETTDGGKMGWYAAKSVGVGIQFGYDQDRTQLIILRPQPTSEILKRIQEALEKSK